MTRKADSFRNDVLENGRSLRRRGPQTRRPSGRPGPEEVVAADGAEGVEDLAAEEEAGVETALQGVGIDLRERHAAAGDLGLAVPLVARPRQGVMGERLHQPAALLAAELGEAAGAVHAGVRQQRLGETVRQVPPEETDHVSRALAQEAVPGRGIHLRPLYEKRLRRPAG